MSEKKHINALIKRYEESLKEDRIVYFDADQFCEIAEYYDELGDIDSVNDILERGLEIHPNNDGLIIRKSKVLLAQNLYKEALSLIENRSLSYDSELYFLILECYIATNRPDDAIKYTNIILEQEKDDLDDFLYDLAYLYLSYNYFSKAVALFLKIKKTDKDIEILFEIGYCYEMLNQIDDAISIYNKILDIDPYSWNGWVNIGRMYTLQEDYNKALEAFDYSIMLSDNPNLNLLRLKANCLILSDKTCDAIPVLKEIYENKQEDTDILLSLAEAYAVSDMFLEAFACLSEYKEKEGEDLAYIKQKTSIYLLMDNIMRAKETLFEGINRLGHDPELKIFAADIDVLCGLYEDAFDKYSAIYDETSDPDIELINKLSTTSTYLEKYDIALFYTKILLEEEPENSEFIRRITLLYLELNDINNYRKMLNEMTDDNLYQMVTLAYQPIDEYSLDRELMLAILDNVIEARILYKNLKY